MSALASILHFDSRRKGLAAAALATLALSLTLLLTPAMARDDTTLSDGENDASLNIRKDDQDGHPLAGAVFTVAGQSGTFTTGADGKFCIIGLPDDSQWFVTEIQAPPGYQIANPASQLVEVDNDGDCASPDARFVNALVSETPTPTPEGSVAGGANTPSPTPEGSVQGGVGTPAPNLPDTATGDLGGPSPIPTIAFAFILLTALGALAWANVKTARSRARRATAASPRGTHDVPRN
jgi:Prealbumin-like fold domain